MTCRVIFTQTFETEYDRILAYQIEKLCSPQAAESLIEALDNACSLLAANPELAAVSTKPALESLELREWLVRNYVVVYRLDKNRIYLERIFHQSQDFEALM